MMRKVNMTLPSSEVISQMPLYAKFLKDIISHMREISEVSSVCLNAECRASISSMPYSLCQKLDIGTLKSTPICLRLVDRFSRTPKGILEDVPVKVGKFYIHTDFFALEMDEEQEILNILARPFLKTTSALMSCKYDSIEFEIGGETIMFHMGKACSRPRNALDCNIIDWLDDYPYERLTPLEKDVSSDESVGNSSMDLLMMDEVELEEEEEMELEDEEEGKEEDKGKRPCATELKVLPASLMYDFLGPDYTLPIVMNATLAKCQTLKLLNVIRKYKGVVGYTIDDLKGEILPSVARL
ncbi:unnamed protein product [Rhodiola kirilowii]